MIWTALKLCKKCAEKCPETCVETLQEMRWKGSKSYVRNEMKMHWNYVINALKVRWNFKVLAPSRTFSAFQRIQRMSYKKLRWNGAYISTRVVIVCTECIQRLYLLYKGTELGFLRFIWLSAESLFKSTPGAWRFRRWFPKSIDGGSQLNGDSSVVFSQKTFLQCWVRLLSADCADSTML